MTLPVPEFSRRIAIDRIGLVAHVERIEANADERAALAKRFGWLCIDALTAEATLTAHAEGIDAEGSVTAAIVQPCVATSEPVPETIDQPFRVRFVAEDPLAAGDDEIELSREDLDIMAQSDGTIDLGEAAAQTVALAADPFPRAPDADVRLKAAGVLGEGESGPFAALKALLKPD